MLDRNLAAIQDNVWAIAANELVNSNIVAELFSLTEILPRNLRQRGIRALELAQPYVGCLFGRPYDEMICSELRRLYSGGLKHIADKLEALSRARHCATQGKGTGAVRPNAMPDPGIRKKTKVEECFVLDVDQLEKSGVLSSHFPPSGLMVLFKTLTGAPLISMWEINRPDSSSLRLTYLAPGSEEVVTSSVEIWRSNRSRKAGTWHTWLIGHHKDDEARELVKSRRLYLPPGAKKFACNQCYDLDYHRSQSMVGLDLSVPFFFQFPQRPGASKLDLRRRTLG